MCTLWSSVHNKRWKNIFTVPHDCALRWWCSRSKRSLNHKTRKLYRFVMSYMWSQREELADFFDALKRCQKIIEADLPKNAHINVVTRSQLDFLDVLLLLPVIHNLATFSFVEIHQNADIYAIFRFDSLYNLSLEINQLLAECIWNILGDESKETRAIKTRLGSNITLEAVKVTILPSLRIFMGGLPKKSNSCTPSSEL